VRLAKTVEEVALATGVSITTVRLVTNGQAGRYRISARTQQRVRDYIDTHGLRVNQVARSLKLQRSEAIGLVIPEISNPFFARLMAELEALCRERGLVLLTASTQEDPDRVTRAVDTLIARGVDGLIVAPSTKSDYAAVLARPGRPHLVFVDRVFGSPPWIAVASDHYRTSLDLTAAMHAVEPGPIAFLCANPVLPSIAARLRGFRKAAKPGDFALKATTDDVAAGRQLMADLLTRHSLGSHGVLCSSLLVLEGALKEVRARGRSVPPHLLLGTYDDHPMLDFLPCRVVSAAQDIGGIARSVLDVLRLQNEVVTSPSTPILLSGTLVERVQVRSKHV
jgi:DNA-binding LacI/PurR family transcriptional regulator